MQKLSLQKTFWVFCNQSIPLRSHGQHTSASTKLALSFVIASSMALGICGAKLPDSLWTHTTTSTIAWQIFCAVNGVIQLQWMDQLQISLLLSMMQMEFPISSVHSILRPVSREYHGFQNLHGSRVRAVRARARVAVGLPAKEPAPAGGLHGFALVQYGFLVQYDEFTCRPFQPKMDHNLFNNGKGQFLVWKNLRVALAKCDGPCSSPTYKCLSRQLAPSSPHFCHLTFVMTRDTPPASESVTGPRKRNLTERARLAADSRPKKKARIVEGSQATIGKGTAYRDKVIHHSQTHTG